MVNTTVYIEVLNMMLDAWIEKVTIDVLKRLLPPTDQEFSQLCHLIPNMLPLNLNFPRLLYLGYCSEENQSAGHIEVNLNKNHVI